MISGRDLRGERGLSLKISLPRQQARGSTTRVSNASKTGNIDRLLWVWLYVMYPSLWTRSSHPPDQRSDLGINPWTAADVARLPAPVSAETASMPADHGLRLDDTLAGSIRGAHDLVQTALRLGDPASRPSSARNDQRYLLGPRIHPRSVRCTRRDDRGKHFQTDSAASLSIRSNHSRSAVSSRLRISTSTSWSIHAPCCFGQAIPVNPTAPAETAASASSLLPQSGQ